MIAIRLLASTLGAFAVAAAAAFGVIASAPAPTANPPPATSVTAAPTIAVSPKATPTLRPIEIYLRAVHEMRTLAVTGNPPFIVFDLRMDSHNLHWYPDTTDGSTDWEVKLVHANESSNYRVWYRSKDEAALVQDAVTHAAYKGESPFAPETTDFSDMTGGGKASPSAAPNAQQKSSDASAQVIGAVTVNGSKYYAVDLVGIEQHEGHPVYHLHLRAYRDTFDYPLTDLWVDTTDYRIWAAHGEVTIRAVAAAMGVGITADFSPVDKYWLVSTIEFTMKGYIAFWHANTATKMQATVVSTPSTLPASYFPSPTPHPSRQP